MPLDSNRRATDAMFMISHAMNSIVTPRNTSRDVSRTVVLGGRGTVAGTTRGAASIIAPGC